MADRWRRQTLASWDVLLDFDHATIATYAYLATGPAATKTGCIRIHKRRLRRELSLRGTQVDAVLTDLIGGRLIEVSTKGDVLTIYLLGMLADCPPSTPNIRRGYLKELSGLGDCEATRAAIADLAESGATDLQVIEHTGGRLSLVDQRSSKHVAHKRIEENRREENKEEILAPATPGTAPKKAKTNPTVVKIVQAYTAICVPARMPKVRTNAEGMPSPSITKMVLKAARANGSDFDWSAYFTQASRGSHLRGENDRKWRATLSWLCNPTNAAKVEAGNYGDSEPPTARGRVARPPANNFGR